MPFTNIHLEPSIVKTMLANDDGDAVCERARLKVEKLHREKERCFLRAAAREGEGGPVASTGPQGAAQM